MYQPTSNLGATQGTWSTQDVASYIGGKNVRAAAQSDHTCSYRLSAALNAAGLPIPGSAGTDVGANTGENYFPLTEDLVKYLSQPSVFGPGLPLGNGVEMSDTVNWDNPHTIQAKLIPGQVAVFVWQGHAGIVTANIGGEPGTGYFDDWSGSSGPGGRYWIITGDTVQGAGDPVNPNVITRNNSVKFPRLGDLE